MVLILQSFLRYKRLRISPHILLAPSVLTIVVLFVGSLLSAWQATSLKHLWSVLFQREVQASLALTLRVSVISTLVSAGLGALLALVVVERSRRWPALNWVLQVPIAVPHVSFTLAAIYLLAPSGLIARILHHAGLVREPAGFPALWNDAHGLGIMCVYIAKEVPFLALLCVTVLVRLDPWLYDQARTIGASTWQRFRNITLPALLPVLAGGSAVVFAFVFSAFEVPLLAGRPFPAMMGVLAQQRFSGADLQDRPEALAMALLMFLIVAVVLATAFRVTRSFE